MKIKNVFIGRKGVRLGWLLSGAAVLYLLSTGGVYFLYRTAYAAMMEIWGVTSENIVRAPAAVQFLYQWSNVIVQLLQNALLIASAILLRRMADVKREQTRHWRGAAFGAGIGAMSIAVIWIILMLIGSVRLGWRITQPAFSVNTFALLLTTVSAALGESVFLYGALYGTLKKRLPIWAAVGIAVVFRMLMQSTFAPMILVNSALTAFVCCLLTEKAGVGAASAFRFAWSYPEQAIFGFAGYAAALYETYPVNLYWLSGGNSGIGAGVLTSIVLIGVCGLLMQPFRTAQRKP